MPQRFFVDTNVFYSKTLMDWLFLLKQENNTMFQLHATEDVFAEVALNMQKAPAPARTYRPPSSGTNANVR